MAAANPYIYIYIGQGAPTILNVDNEADSAALEQLGAVKMPEAMVTEVFGDNVRYADNTNTAVTPNPDNPAFPFNVQFDSSKIPAKPKRELGNMIDIGMPSEKYIEIEKQQIANRHFMAEFTAPANGWLFAYGKKLENAFAPALSIYKKDSLYGTQITWSSGDGYTNQLYSLACYFPAQQGETYIFNSQHYQNIMFRFVYAQGEI